MNGQESRRVVGSVTDFEGLDAATRIEHVMRLPDEERQALVLHLIFENRNTLAEIRRERRWAYGVGHLFAIVVASLAGIFGQPLRP
ncbi:hypothetical protein LCGC14_1551080 [marine sediment metagenome]|uniref:Uncharacterized protein n=1 Tax=marine sediment metagenome TaxID=412755 RepID=A0A0F9IQD0_9ZZZZ